MAISYFGLTEAVIMYGPQFTRHWHTIGGLTEETLKSTLQAVHKMPKVLCRARHAMVILFICIFYIYLFSVYVYLCMCTLMFKHMHLLACVQYGAWRSKKNLQKLVLLSTMLLAWIQLRSKNIQKSTFILGSSHQIFFSSFTQQHKQLK